MLNAVYTPGAGRKSDRVFSIYSTFYRMTTEDYFVLCIPKGERLRQLGSAYESNLNS